MTTESDVLKEWRETAPHWEKHAPTIKTMFAPLTRALIEEAVISQGQKVLDVAGGAGEPSLSIAEVVGPTGSVTCTDPVAQMVKTAETEASRRGLTNVEFRQCAVDALPFDDNCFDAVVSRLGVMFFPDPIAGLREMMRVVRSNGVLSLTVWGRSDLNPFSYVVNNVAGRYIELPPPDADAPGAFRFAEPGKLVQVMEEAGLTNVRDRLLDFRIEAPISTEEFWQMRSETSATLRENLAKLRAEERNRISREAQEAVREFFPDGRMSFPAQMITVSGSKQ
jgi:SAM-dependent methyltransferase